MVWDLLKSQETFTLSRKGTVQITVRRNPYLLKPWLWGAEWNTFEKVGVANKPSGRRLSMSLSQETYFKSICLYQGRSFHEWEKPSSKRRDLTRLRNDLTSCSSPASLVNFETVSLILDMKAPTPGIDSRSAISVITCLRVLFQTVNIPMVSFRRTSG